MGKMSKALQKYFPKEKAKALSEGSAGREAWMASRVSALHGGGENAAKVHNLFAYDRWDKRLKISTDPHSTFFEGFRRLRSSILYPASGPRPRSLLVTSVVPHEGKGFVCANLGVALSQHIEHHALMVDCDFRHPALAPLFGFTSETGVVDHLNDDVDLSLLIRKTGQPKLSLIPSGKPPRNPSEMLGSQKMTEFINELVDRYDDRIVLFDSPPNIVASETNILARQMDGVVLVVRYGAAKKSDVKKFVDQIGPEKIYGLIFNAYPENTVEAFMDKKMGYGYSYYYHSQY